MSAPILLKSFYHRHEAEMAKGLLEEAGIETFISSDDLGGYRPHLNFTTGMNRLMIRPEDLTRAREVIAVLDND